MVLASAVFARSPLQDVVGASPVSFASQTQSVGYLLGAPLFGLWDTLSLLALTQHYAVLVTLIAFWVSWRSRRWPATRGGGSGGGGSGGELARVGGRSLPGLIGKEALRWVAAFIALLAFYAAGMLLPRPMTGIRLDDRALVAIDFHSHTNHSHDGWSLFTEPRNRSWHEQGGFDAAYVTDHYTWAGVDEAEQRNPTLAGERTVLLSGAEIRIHGRPTNILGERDRYLFALDAERVFMDPDSIAARYRRAGPKPTLLYTMPGALSRVVPFTDETPGGMIGIEINDGSPRGLEQVKAERVEIIALADSMNLALIGAANLHGWGRTVASWSVMTIPEWQGMTPADLATAIEEVLHTGRRNAVVVVERRMPYHDGSPVRVAFTLPSVMWEHFRMLSWAERLSWLFWIVATGPALAVVSRRRDPQPDTLSIDNKDAILRS